jgi:hypothetical protein
LAAVDDHGVTDLERGLVGAQPQHSGGDLSGRPMRPMGSWATTTLAPSRPNASAVARPTPLVAPVTKVTLSPKRLMGAGAP